MRKKHDRAEFECFSDCGSAKRAANRRCHQGEAQVQKVKYDMLACQYMTLGAAQT